MFNPRLFTRLWVTRVFASRSPLLVTEFVALLPPCSWHHLPRSPFGPHRLKASQTLLYSFFPLFLIPTTLYPAISSFEEHLHLLLVFIYVATTLAQALIPLHLFYGPPATHVFPPTLSAGRGLFSCYAAMSCEWLPIPTKSCLPSITLNSW